MIQNEIIKTSILAILSFLVFTKFYNLLSRGFIFLEVKYEIDSVFVLLFTYLAIGSLSIILLLFLYNRYLKNNLLRTFWIYELITGILLLTLFTFGINYANKILFESVIDRSRLPNQNARTMIMNIILPVIGLVIFFKKLKSNKKYSD